MKDVIKSSSHTATPVTEQTATRGPHLCCRFHISASLKSVWAAVTEPDHRSTWFAPTITLDERGVGATGVFNFGENSLIPVRIEEVNPPRTIAYRWSADDASAEKAGGARPDIVDDAHSMLMRFTLEPISDGIRLTVVVSGLDTTVDPTRNTEGHRNRLESDSRPAARPLRQRPVTQTATLVSVFAALGDES